MTTAQIEKKLKKLIKSYTPDTFIYDLLKVYGKPKASITRLQKGSYNLSKIEGEVCWKKNVFFKVVKEVDLHLTIANLKETIHHEERFIIVTDFKELLAIDTKTNEGLDIEFLDLEKHYDFFLPWAGMEKAAHKDENPADVKAAVKMAKLFDEIRKENPTDTPEFIHGLNVFLSRLLFCFFAEDTNIFEDNQFTKAISSHTQTDGSDLEAYLAKLFKVLNTPNNKRKNLPAYLNAFPYVNGGLFEHTYTVPTFNRRARKAIIDSGEMSWAEINPDIFGSMFQAVISSDQRGSLGQHYTSVPNIMKVIEPLFLNELYEAFEKSKDKPKKLDLLLLRIQRLKIFDPACGSGNFLIIAYRELRKLEMEILKVRKLPLPMSGISLSQFYGIELDDFAHEIARLALWLVEHQMNVEFLKEFGNTKPALPLKDAGNIAHGNACRLDWEVVCPKKEGDEVYILGNPPYLGARMQNKEQKSDLTLVYSKYGSAKKVDYISCWFLKGAEYIKNFNAEYSFVTTNSICQGEQVSLIWAHIIDDLEISFAYTSFKWENNAKKKAGVIVIIVGVRNIIDKNKYIYTNEVVYKVKNINPYLADYRNVFVERRSVPISFPFNMEYGNMAIDGGYLILSPEEKEKLVNCYPYSKSFIRKIYGAQEFLNGVERYCLWVKDSDLSNAEEIPEVKKRFELVREKRLSSTDKGTKKLAEKPHQFREMKEGVKSALIVPTVSSERRKYIPISFVNKDCVIIAPNQAIYDAEPWVFSFLSSTTHMVWVRTVAGRLKTDYRYSSALCYNTFPFPSISKQRKEELTKCTFRILEEREKHSDKTLAQLYDPDKMPEGLKEAHRQNDLAVERCYRSKPFESDEERLAYLFKLYEKMIQKEATEAAALKNKKRTRKTKS